MKRYVIYNPVDGLFLGEFLGLCFWSKMDNASQTHAPSYETEEEAKYAASIYAPKNADLNGNVRCIEISETDMADEIYVDIIVAEYEINKIKKKDDILYKLARIVRGTDCIHPTNRGRMLGDLLSNLRILDNSRYDREVIANPKIIEGE